MSVPGRVYTVKGQKHLAGLAAEYAPPILAALEEWVGREYPYRKLDLIAIPEYWPGAMENPGAVTYRDGMLLVDPEAASMSQKRTLARVHAHEFAHMWFGDLVTMAWWDDLWLNESFADWLGDKITDEVFPDFKIAISELESNQNTMQGDGRQTTVPVRKPVNSTADMMEGLGLAYNKGKTILRMTEMWIGEDRMQEGVRNYINANAWKNTVANDLFTALSDAGEQDLTPILSTFLDQPGYPTVAVDVASGGLITLSQERFAYHGADADPYLWNVPVRLKYSDGEQVHTRAVMLDKESMQIEVGTEVEWAMPNEGAYGYYRWSAPSHMLFTMAENPEKTMSERERAVFLSNASALLAAGELGGDDYLTLLGTMATYPEPEIVSSVMSSLGSVRGAFVTDDLEDAFAAYVRTSLGPALDSFGLEPREGENDQITLVRPRLVSWLGGWGQDPEVRAKCKEWAAAYMKDPQSMDPSLAGRALRVAAIEGDEALYEAYLKAFETTEVPADRGRYLSALGYFPTAELQDRTLAMVGSGKARPQEMFGVISALSRTEEGHDRVFQWMMDSYEGIASRMPPMMMAYMPYMASGCSEERLAAARAFFAEPAHNVEGTDRNLEKVAESTGVCVDLREREGAKVADYLNRLSMK
jgi:alanyl aminopeptidase